MSRSFVHDLFVRIRAGYSFIGVNTAEESRCLLDIKRAGWMMADGRGFNPKPAARSAISETLSFVGCSPLPPAGEVTIQAEVWIRAYDRAIAADNEIGADAVATVLDAAGYPVIAWDMIDGFGSKKAAGEPGEALELITVPPEDPDKLKQEEFPARSLFVIKDAHLFLNSPDNPMWRRIVRNLYEQTRLVNKAIRRPVIFLQPDWVPHPDIAPCVSFLDFALPDAAQLDHEITYAEASVGPGPSGAVVTCPAEFRQDLVYALRGLTQGEAANALSLGLVANGGFVPGMLADIRRVKAHAMKSDDTLEYIDEEKLATAEDIGGYENYLEYVAECRACYTPEAAAAGLKRPKGVLLLGVPGSGKSVVAAATARLLRLPLLNFDFGSVFGGVVGQSESTMRRSLKRITAQGPCVVRVDEADKAFAGMQQTSGDSGVGQRVFGRLLSWMANENEDAFIVMTMNRLEGVPIEMIRSGRLDATFYTSLPGPVERRQILQIHLRRNGTPAGTFSDDDLDRVIAHTEDFVGSEIEQVAVKATRIAWAARQATVPTVDELLAAAGSVNSVSALDEANIKKILEFCEKRATPVSRTPPALKIKKLRKTGNIVVN